jgi:hypothetical protein
MTTRILFTLVFAGIAILQSTAQRSEIAKANCSTLRDAAKPAKKMLASRRTLHSHVAKNSGLWDQLLASYTMDYLVQHDDNGQIFDKLAAGTPQQSEMQAILSFYGDIYACYFGRFLEQVKTVFYPDNQSLDKQQ